jgi:hypothetical protein
MKLADWERCCAWRAMETGDPECRWLGRQQRDSATGHTREKLSAEDVQKGPLSAAARKFLEARAQWLDVAASDIGQPPQPATWRRALRLPRLPRSLRWGSLAGALALGLLLTQIGNERELNLLALPLAGLLLWNAVVVLVSLAGELRGWKAGGRRDGLTGGGPILALLRKQLRRSEKGIDLPPAIQHQFESLAANHGAAILGTQLRCWLHVLAVVVAAGSVLGLFARGWSTEYRAVWESTLLDEAGAKRFFSALFAPASALLGLPVPLEDVPGMRRGADIETTPAPALPWLKLYAATLLGGIASPRLLLILLARARVGQELARAWQNRAWQAYAGSLLRRLEGGGQPVTLLAPGTVVSAELGEVWSGWLAQQFGGQARIDCRGLPPEDEDEWLVEWEPVEPELVVAFRLATTPESEVQGALLSRLWMRLRQQGFEPQISLLLDARGMARRWDAAQIRSRLLLWQETAGSAAEVFVGDEKGLSPLRRYLS